MRFFVSVLVLALSGCSVTPHAIPAATIEVAETVPPEGVEGLAMTAVRHYFDVSARVAADGGREPERIAEAVTAQWLPQEMVGFEALRALGSTQVGAPTVTKMEVAAVRGIAAVAEVVVYACTSLDGVSIATDDGEFDSPTGLSLVTVYVVPENGVLKVDGVEPWADVSWCAEV